MVTIKWQPNEASKIYHFIANLIVRDYIVKGRLNFTSHNNNIVFLHWRIVEFVMWQLRYAFWIYGNVIWKTRRVELCKQFSVAKLYGRCAAILPTFPKPGNP